MCGDRVLRVGMLALVFGVLALLVTVTVAGAQPTPKIRIQVKKNFAGPGNCDDPGDCEIFIKDRGLGVCKTEKSDGGQKFCDDEFEWDLIGTGQLVDENIIVVQWNNRSTTGSEACLDRTVYVLTTDVDKVTASVQNVAGCQAKSVWFYDVILLHGGTEVDRDDPGVIIDN